MSPAEFRPLPLETQLESKLETFREANRDFESAKARARYLGAWLYRMSVDIARLRYEISNQQRDEQLRLWEEEVVIQIEQEHDRGIILSPAA